MSKDTRNARIIELFNELGAMSPRSLAQECLARGIFDREWEATVAIRAATRECRDVLSGAKDESGVRCYGQTTKKDPDGATVWAQRDFWEVDDYRLNIREHVRNRDANHEAAAKLRDECQARYRVSIPLEQDAAALKAA